MNNYEILTTTRGSLFYIKNNHEKKNSILFLDWPFASGFIEVPNVSEDVLLKGFNWSLNLGFIEEDASIHSVLYAIGCLDKKSIKNSIIFPKYFPKFVNLKKDRFIELLDNKSIFNIYCHTYSFPSSVDYIKSVYPIVNSIELLHSLFDAGVNIVQLRVKENQLANLAVFIEKACKISFSYPDSKLFINDHWHLAIENNAFGVHLGQEDINQANMQKIQSSGIHLGLSSHSYWEVSNAIKYSPSYLACGPIFPTRVKIMPWKPQGIKNLTYWSRILAFPIVAIGGINISNIRDVKASNCSGVAVIDAVVNKKDPIASFRTLDKIWKEI